MLNVHSSFTYFDIDFVNNNKLFQDFVANVATTANGSDTNDVGVDALMETRCATGNGQKMSDALGDIVTAIRLVIFLLTFICKSVV